MVRIVNNPEVRGQAAVRLEVRGYSNEERRGNDAVKLFKLPKLHRSIQVLHLPAT